MRLAATAFGFDAGTENSWRMQALCAGRWDEFEFIRIEPGNADAARAAHQCRHCPVFAQCLAFTEANPPDSGIVQAARHRPYGKLVEIDDRHVQCYCRPAVPKVRNYTHGTVHSYKHGCHCDLCNEVGRAANKDSNMRRRWRRRAELFAAAGAS